MLRVGVIEQLGEGGQRLLLDRLAGVLASPLGQYTPVGVVTLEAMALLLEVLGEVSAEKHAELEPAIGAKVAGPHACLRLQAAAAVAALAVAEPSSAARLVGASLANLHAAREKLVAATEAAAPDRSRPSVPSTPRGVGSVKLKPDMNAVHGWALSGAALVAASRRLPLGIPSALLASVLDYAVGLIREPRGKQVCVLGFWCLGAAVLRCWQCMQAVLFNAKQLEALRPTVQPVAQAVRTHQAAHAHLRCGLPAPLPPLFHPPGSGVLPGAGGRIHPALLPGRLAAS